MPIIVVFKNFSNYATTLNGSGVARYQLFTRPHVKKERATEREREREREEQKREKCASIPPANVETTYVQHDHSTSHY